MPRHARRSLGGIVYHVLNRAHSRVALFRTSQDYEAFENLLGESHQRQPIRILAYCLMPNHWHLVLWPEEDGQLSRFIQWVTATHARRWRLNRGSVGLGYVYQDRFKSFPVEDDEHLLTVCRYVERNPLTAKLVHRAEQWRWSSLWRRVRKDRQHAMQWLAHWPTRPSSLDEWLSLVNGPQNEKELARLQQCSERGVPFGSSPWCERIARGTEELSP
jgi:putative transposase